MSQNKAGDIVGIRDWSNRYFYNKDEIADFFIKASSGLKAYLLTIIAVGETEITITENVQISPQTYVITTPIGGKYEGLFFFHQGSTLTLSISGQTPVTYTLTDYIDEIQINSYTLATPVMTANDQPSGLVTCSSYYTAILRPPYLAFDQNNSTFWTTAPDQKVGAWICYTFDSPKVISKVKTRNIPEATYKSVMKAFRLQGSNDGTNWTTLSTITDNPFTENYEYEFDVAYPGSYSKYRIICDDVYTQDPANGVGFSEINLYEIQR